MVMPPSGFVASNSNSRPAFTTYTSPSSLAKYTLPSAAIVDAVNAVVPLPSRCCYTFSPVFASKVLITPLLLVT